MRQIFDSCPELKGDSLQARDTQRRLETESCGDCRIACFPIGRHVQDRGPRRQQRPLGPVVFGIQVIHSQPAVEREIPALLERKVDAGADDPAVIPGFQVFFQGQVINLGVTVGFVCERLGLLIQPLIARPDEKGSPGSSRLSEKHPGHKIHAMEVNLPFRADAYGMAPCKIGSAERHLAAIYLSDPTDQPGIRVVVYQSHEKRFRL